MLKLMDKLGRVALPLVLALALAGCVADDGSVHQGQTDENAEHYASLTTLEEYGIAPLELTRRDRNLLAVMPGIGPNDVLLAEFYAPEEATVVEMQAWDLDANGDWHPCGAIREDLTNIKAPDEAMRGVISAHWSIAENEPKLAMELHYQTSGGTYTIRGHNSVGLEPEEDYGAGMKLLDKPAEIVLAEPIPLMIVSLHAMDDGMENFGMGDYFNTEKFAGSLYTGAVTVTFLNDAGEDL